MTKAEIEKRITEMEQELDSLKAQLNEPEEKTGWEKPVWGQTYWFIDELGEVEGKDWKDDELDEKRYACGNCFTSKELAENIARYTSLDLRIRRRIAEICEPVDWDNGASCKFYIYYDHSYKELDVSGWYGNQYSGWHCDTKEHAKQIIEEFKDELTWYFTEFKDRMDGQED